jgi:hypothetical protein
VSFFVWHVTPNLTNMGGPTSSHVIAGIAVMYTNAQKLSRPVKYVFDKVKFMDILSELGHLQDKMYLFYHNNDDAAADDDNNDSDNNNNNENDDDDNNNDDNNNNNNNKCM